MRRDVVGSPDVQSMNSAESDNPASSPASPSSSDSTSRDVGRHVITTSAPRAASAGDAAIRRPGLRRERARALRGAIPDGERERRLREVTGHRRADGAEPKEGNVHDEGARVAGVTACGNGNAGRSWRPTDTSTVTRPIPCVVTAALGFLRYGFDSHDLGNGRGPCEAGGVHRAVRCAGCEVGGRRAGSRGGRARRKHDERRVGATPSRSPDARSPRSEWSVDCRSADRRS